MIDYTTGDIIKSDAEALVNTVNCVGIMGRGIALQFKKAFPANFKAYKSACDRGEVQPGRMFVHETGALQNPRYIINFPTKRHWKGRSRIEDIDAGLDALVAEVERLGITSIAIPPLGSGLGGLDWNLVEPRVEKALARVPDTHAIVFRPSGPPSPRDMVRSSKVPEMTPGRAALVGLLHRYLSGLMDPFISLLEIHKLMYFMQESGEKLRLRYVKAPFGPYAENLRQVLSDMEGHMTFGYGEGGDQPDKTIELVPGAITDAAQFLQGTPATLARFERVAELVAGFETSFGLELLSTVHWIARHDSIATVDELVAATYAWGDNKRMFSSQQIEVAWMTLRSKGWLS